MKKLGSIFFLTALFAQGAFANLSAECVAHGFKTTQAGSGRLYTDAKLQFDIEDFDADSDEVMTIAGITGYIKVNIEGNEPMTNNNTYSAYFEIDQLQSNPNYRPRRYTDMVQFRGFNAARTSGLESGMWGNFLVEKTLGETFKAKYIFQAGDHMGGVIHFSCRSHD